MYDKFIANTKLQDWTTNVDKWSSNTQHTLSNKRETRDRLPIKEEARYLKPPVSRSPQNLLANNVDVKNEFDMEITSDGQVITNDYLPKQHPETLYSSLPGKKTKNQLCSQT
ncbi:unnamed protein product, partial [Iphiclides podalirius]